MDQVIRVSGDGPNLGDFLKDAMMSQTFADVALCCTGGQRFFAHRLVLSAASPYLQDVLLAHGKIVGNYELITVILADVESNDLSALLGFIYTGTTSVPRERLLAFSQTANALKIRIPPLPIVLEIPVSLESPKNKAELKKNDEIFINHCQDYGNNFVRPFDCCRSIGSIDREDYTRSELMKYCRLADNDSSEFDCCLNLTKTHLPTTINKIKKFYVANRVSASPWCQLAQPHHLPRLQPIVINSKIHSSVTSINTTVGSFSSSSHSPSKEESERSLNARISSAYGRTITPPPPPPPLSFSSSSTFATQQDISQINVPVLDHVHHISTAPIPVDIKQVDEDDIYDRINNSPKILTTLLSHSEASRLDASVKETFIGQTELENFDHTARLQSDDNNNINNNDRKLEREEIAASLEENHHHKCQICEKTFGSRSSLKVHGRTHSGEKPFRCSDCGKEFSQLRNYKYHRSIHEGTGEFSATCPECGKSFNDKGYLGSHMKIHRNKKEYACEICGKSFNQRVAYNMHIRIHTGLKPHHCDKCDKSFSRKMLLKQHLRTHSGERPYKCHICEKAFADRSNMTLHTRLHSGLKPYQCDICSKAFTKKHHLKTHLNYHTGTKPYSCPNCKLTFSQSSNMRTHYKKCLVNNPTNEKVINCNEKKGKIHFNISELQGDSRVS